MQSEVRIGTRASQLALWQANHVRNKLLERHPTLSVQLVKITTTGDRLFGQPLRDIGGKGLFLKEIEEALLNHDIDLSVHSLKDVPAQLPEGLMLAATLARENPLDALVLAPGQTRLKQGASVATGSLRRRCQLSRWRNDLVFEDIRGNIDTRLFRLADSGFDALVLAVAGLKRMGWGDRISRTLEADILVPAAGQGAITVEVRSNDSTIRRLVEPLNHLETSLCTSAERAFTAIIEADCSLPVGAWARIEGENLRLTSCIADAKTGKILRAEASGRPPDYYRIGQQAASDIIAQGGDAIIQGYRDSGH